MYIFIGDVIKNTPVETQSNFPSIWLKTASSYFMGYVAFSLSKLARVVSVENIARVFLLFFVFFLFLFVYLLLLFFFLLLLYYLEITVVAGHVNQNNIHNLKPLPIIFTHISYNCHWKPNSGVIWPNSWEAIADTFLEKICFYWNHTKRPLTLTLLCIYFL